MSPTEIALHARKRIFQLVDGMRERDWAAVTLESSGVYPRVPSTDSAPPALREALRRDVEAILRGHWTAFGHLDLKVDDPPKWHCDYLAGRDLATTQSAFRLDHRNLPGGADIKLIWELSRWHQLVRLAMAAHVLDDERAAEKGLLWLEDWIKHNPPFRGWNWTNALESGLRLIQFTWIDALLTGKAETWGFDAELETLRHEVLPPHAWFTWRHQSFGSSANNHLLGELAGLIVATARWPALAQWGASLDALQPRWEHEVLAQFAPDGGNQEQALNYHLFSWQFGWQARAALTAAGRTIPPEVDERLRRAAQFFLDVQVPEDPWDYGDSDQAYVLPVFADETRSVGEWHEWLRVPERSAAIEYWLGDSRRAAGLDRWRDSPAAPSASNEVTPRSVGTRSTASPSAQAGSGTEWNPSLPGGAVHGVVQGSSLVHPSHLSLAAANGQPGKSAAASAWRCYEHSGYALYRQNDLILRWDLSPLGYLKTAAHGHLDALHLSVWVRGVAMVIDPGTGCYYADKRRRAWLASRAAHNAPNPEGVDHPQRLGPFLWGPHDDILMWSAGDESWTPAELQAWFEKTVGQPMPFTPETPLSLSGGVAFLHAAKVLIQRLLMVPTPDRVEVEDTCWRDGRTPDQPFSVRWQFAPGASLTRLEERRFRVTRKDVSLNIEVSANWAEVHPVTDPDSPGLATAAATDPNPAFDGMVSRAFRKIDWAPFLKLIARPRPGRPWPFRTVFSLGG
jgi:hypothetical protein